MKALHVTGVKTEDVLYAPTEEFCTDDFDDDEPPVEPHVTPPDTVDLSNVPVAYTRIGDGFLGYIGDVNAEEASTGVTLAMLRL